MMKKRSKKIALISGVFVIAGLLSIMTLTFFEAGPDKAPPQTSTLSGFVPQTKVTYKIQSSKGIEFEEEGRVGDDGTLAFQCKKEFDAETFRDILHIFEIETDDDILEVFLRDMPGENRITAGGAGIDEFSEFTVKAPGNYLQSKADWAGTFHADLTLEQYHRQQRSVQIALLGMDGIQFPGNSQPRPGIIEITRSPIGGPQSVTPTSDFVRAAKVTTELLSAVAMQQIFAIGTFFDAKLTLETQRTHQSLKAQAVKDYHPSDQMCRIGSYVRSLAQTEAKARANKLALNEILMTRYTNETGTTNAAGSFKDAQSRLAQFRSVYCNPKDNNSAMGGLCGSGGSDKRRLNKDIDYARTMEFPQTLEVDLQDGAASPDEEDVIALAKNLYWPTVLEFGNQLDVDTNGGSFLKAKRVIALNNLAHNSFTSLASLKAKSAEPGASPDVEPGWSFMKAMLREFGIPDEEIEDLIGKHPSYWAQMDVMTKKIYQSPNFYTNLYDKPANIDRISVALDAIRLMQMRDHYDSALRREILTSGMVETELSNVYNTVNAQLLQ